VKRQTIDRENISTVCISHLEYKKTLTNQYKKTTQSGKVKDLNWHITKEDIQWSISI
jgi:hypothetical protein